MATPNTNTVARYFEPCAATASMFLYAQGTSVVCCHHDTLAIERRFARHSEEVQLLAVDNHSDIGAGRLVVSYDAGQTAIVWDLLTGDEVARFASYENLTCAAWMRNGNVVFGEYSSPWMMVRLAAVNGLADGKVRQYAGQRDTLRAHDVRAPLCEDARPDSHLGHLTSG
jgi:WD40 repeat protein